MDILVGLLNQLSENRVCIDLFPFVLRSPAMPYRPSPHVLFCQPITVFRSPSLPVYRIVPTASLCHLIHAPTLPLRLTFMTYLVVNPFPPDG